jgi:hypothetical protein
MSRGAVQGAHSTQGPRAADWGNQARSEALVCTRPFIQWSESGPADTGTSTLPVTQAGLTEQGIVAPSPDYTPALYLTGASPT